MWGWFGISEEFCTEFGPISYSL